MRYEVIVDVNDKAESDGFEAWLQQYQNEVIAISENSGCGCCVNIFTIEVTDNAQPFPIFAQADLDKFVELHYGLEKNRIINDYLNYYIQN